MKPQAFNPVTLGIISLVLASGCGANSDAGATDTNNGGGGSLAAGGSANAGTSSSGVAGGGSNAAAGASSTVAAGTSPTAGSTDPAPVEGSSRGTLSYQGGVYTVNISGGQPPQMDNNIMGNTVLDGQNGYHVACTVKGAGAEYSGNISGPDGTSLDVYGPNASVGATFTADMYGTATAGGTGAGTINTLRDTGCTIVKLAKAEAGTIWAEYQCNNLTTPSGVGQVGHSLAEFLFTGCNK